MLYQPRLLYREGSRQVVSLDKKAAPFYQIEMILLRGDAAAYLRRSDLGLSYEFKSLSRQ
jgi:hypothetical protein